MIINGDSLLEASPIEDMHTIKVRLHGVSFGLSEAGYDIRLRQNVLLHPFRRFTIASAIERFNMPDDLVGIVHDKSTFARKGLSVFNTVIEPGWRGYLTLELVYHGFWPLRIKAGSGIAQVVFHRTSEPRPYGDGKYQNQPDRPVAAINA